MCATYLDNPMIFAAMVKVRNLCYEWSLVVARYKAIFSSIFMPYNLWNYVKLFITLHKYILYTDHLPLINNQSNYEKNGSLILLLVLQTLHTSEASVEIFPVLYEEYLNKLKY